MRYHTRRSPLVVYQDRIRLQALDLATMGAQGWKKTAAAVYHSPTDPNTSDHAPNELALEFLFFDLASCVQNDTQPPIIPN